MLSAGVGCQDRISAHSTWIEMIKISDQDVLHPDHGALNFFGCFTYHAFGKFMFSCISL